MNLFNLKYCFFGVNIIVILLSNLNIYGNMNNINPPIAKQEQKITKIHGHELVDNYDWLRDKNWPNVTKQDVIDYLKEENEYGNSVFFNSTKEIKEKIFNEIKGRIKLADQSTYVKKDDYYYYNRIEADKNYKIHCRKYQNTDAKEQVILDENALAKDKKYMQIGTLSVSNDHKLLAYSVDYEGNERFEASILNIATQEDLVDRIPNTIGGLVWNNDNTGFFYTPADEQWRHKKVYFHKLGQKYEDDKLIFEEKDDMYSVSVYKSSDKKILFINVGGHANNEIYFADLTDFKNIEREDFKLIKPRSGNIEYSVDHNNGDFYIHINDKGDNFRIAKVKASESHQQDKWTDFIPLDPKRYLGGFDITKNFLVLNYKNKGLPEVEVMDLAFFDKKLVHFEDASYIAKAYSTNFFEDDIRIDYSSLKRPNTTYQYTYTGSKLTVLKEQEIPSGFNADDYESERIWADNNGVKVPISIVYKKSTFKKDGSNPLYLIGYGAYGISYDPSFRASIFSIVDRGIIFAIAHIRGGSDLGYSWYMDGKLKNKKNTFTDFISCSEKLINDKYTSKGNIISWGGSAGGLLIGNILNMRPDLYKGAIVHVAFVDFMNTMLDETLPLTPGEYNEWGNPSKDKDVFEYMLSYSPYDNIKEQKYPHIFVTGSISDPRVGYWEPAKWVAKLREVKRKLSSDTNYLILKTNMDAGHKGASGRFDYIKEVADDYVFALKIWGLIN